MNISFTEIIAAIEKLTNGSQHEKYARHNMLIASTTTMELLEHYTELKATRPKTYLEDVISGKMATLFKKAVSGDEQAARDIFIVAKLGPNLSALTRAIKQKTEKANISEKEHEHAAMNIIREIVKQTPKISQVKTKIKEKIEQLATTEDVDEELVHSQLDDMLTSNYMNRN